MTDAIHERFLRRLTKSEAAVWRIAMWFSSRGENVTVHATHKAPTREEHSHFSDLGDIDVHMRVEVKQLGCTFTCAEDWPFPDFLVCNKAAYDKSLRKPRYFYYLNAAGTHCAVLDVRSTKQRWKAITRRDKTYDKVGGKGQEEFYACLASDVKFHSITDAP